MTNKALKKQYEDRAQAETAAGGSIKINPSLPTVFVYLSNGDEYLLEGYEADEALAEVPDNIAPEDYILAQAQNW